MELALRIRVFVASPGDVEVERLAMDRVIEELNRTIGRTRQLAIELKKWETHAIPGPGRLQAVVNDSIGEYEFLVGIMWKRFGTPTGIAGSGTEEEFELANKSYLERGVPTPMFYFSRAPYVIETLEELRQLEDVLRFRLRISSTNLVGTYDDPRDFERKIRVHLYTVIDDTYGKHMRDRARPRLSAEEIRTMQNVLNDSRYSLELQAVVRKQLEAAGAL